MNIAIFLSGGTGSRVGSEIPKQYVKMGDCMMVTHALKSLLKSDHVDVIYIVAAEEWQQEIIRDAEDMKYDTSKIRGFALPGENRQLSILNGLREAEKTFTNTVLIHDAARPFLTTEFLDDIYSSLPGHDGVLPVLPMKDTVYFSETGKTITNLLEREKIFAGQAPELFVFDKYMKANEALLPEKILSINGSTEPAILAGMDITMIPGDENNIKITTAADLEKYII